MSFSLESKSGCKAQCRPQERAVPGATDVEVEAAHWSPCPPHPLQAEGLFKPSWCRGWGALRGGEGQGAGGGGQASALNKSRLIPVSRRTLPTAWSIKAGVCSKAFKNALCPPAPHLVCLSSRPPSPLTAYMHCVPARLD